MQDKQKNKEVCKIKYKLNHGDMPVIAKMVGCSRIMVASVLRGERNANTDLGKKIIKAATLFVEQRENLTKEFQSQ